MRPDQLPSLRTSRYAGLDSPQDLGPPYPPTGLGPMGVKPRTSDTVIRPDVGLDPREPLSPRVLSPRENLDWSMRETGAPSSPYLHRSWSSGKFSQPGTGFLQARHLSRRCVLRRPAGQAPTDTFVRCLLPQLPTTITRTRWLPALSAKLTARAKRWALGPTT